MEWSDYYFRLVDLVASKSKDPSTKVGCVIIGSDHEIRSTGYNGLPRGCKDDVPDRDVRPTKYYYYEHAERNTIYNATRVGVSLKGCTAYMHSLPCADCARGLIQAGITHIVIRSLKSLDRWRESVIAGLTMICESGIIVDCPTTGTDIGIWLLEGYRSGKVANDNV